MALLFINEIDKDVRLGVWEMEENLNYEKFASLPFYDRLMSLSDGRRKETASVATEILLSVMNLQASRMWKVIRLALATPRVLFL